MFNKTQMFYGILHNNFLVKIALYKSTFTYLLNLQFVDKLSVSSSRCYSHERIVDNASAAAQSVYKYIPLKDV